jgi:hypothetical protein
MIFLSRKGRNGDRIRKPKTNKKENGITKITIGTDKGKVF